MSPRVWLVSAPCESEFLGYTGEPTPVMYAGAVLWDETIHGRVKCADGPLRPEDIRLFAWRVASGPVFEELERNLRIEPPRVVCISTTTPAIPYALRIAECVKSIVPDAFVMFGGPHEDAIHRVAKPGAKRYGFIDASVAGDGEYILHAIVARAVAMEPFTPDEFLSVLSAEEDAFAGVPGEWHLALRPVSVAVTPRRRRMRLTLYSDSQEIRLPLPPNGPRIPRALLVRDRPHMARGFDIFAHGRRPVPTAQVITARSCSWRCSFCTEWRGGQYDRTVEDIIEEIREAMSLGYGAVFFDDSTFLDGFGAETTPSVRRQRRYNNPARKAFVRELLAKLGPLGIEWGCQTRVDTLEDGILAELRKAGCTYIYFGAESASEEQLTDMQKWQTRNDISTALDRVRRAGIRIGLSLLFCPASWKDVEWTRETEASVATTLAFFRSELHKGGVSVISRNIMAYYPGTVRTKAVSDLGIDLWQGLPLAVDGELPHPWNRFEDGGGHHARNVTVGLANAIVEASEKMLGPWVVKSYIHAHRIPELDARGTPTDLVHYTGSWREPTASVPQPSFEEQVNDALREGHVAVFGMHLLEAVRDLPVDSHEPHARWHLFWTVADSAAIVEELSKLYLPMFRAIAIPAVIPETGCIVNFERIRECLARSSKRFAGTIVIDVSDLPASASSEFVPNDLREQTILLRDRGRVCCSMEATPQEEELRYEQVCFHRRSEAVAALQAMPLKVEIIGDNEPGYAPHILAFRVAKVDQFALVQRLWRDWNILATFIGPLDLVRLQFDERTTAESVKRAMDAIGKLMMMCQLQS